MARIDRAEIERIKRETDIVKLIESYGTQLKDRNKEGEWLGKCPVHDDHDASLCVNAETNLWCCHGACGKGGDVYQWVMLAENCSFDCAHDILKEGVYGGKVASKYSKSRKLACPLPFDAEEQALLGKVVQYYQDRLQDSEDAKNYLAARGIGDPQAIAHFRIGFVDRSLGRRIPPKPIKAGREMRAKLETLGIMKATTGHEQFRGCIVFPIFNLAGDIVQMYGRRIDRTAKASERHWYMSRPRAGIFNAEALQIYDEIILVESVIDAITFWVAGYQNVTTAWGNNGFTDEMLEAYKAANVKRVLIGYDNDDASNNKIPALQAKLNAANIDTFRMKYGACKDANEYAVKLQMGLDKGRNGHASLGLSIRNAEWLGNGVASNGVSPTITTDTPDFLKRARESIACEATIEANREAVANEPQQAIVSEPVVSEPIVATNESAAKEENAMEPQVSSLTPQASQKLQPTESRVPDAPKPAMIEAEIKDNEVLIPIGNRTYRVRGLERNAAFDVLKVNVLVRNGEAFFVDTLDLYAARSRNLFIKEASKELSMEEEAIKRDLGKIMLKLEELQDNRVELDSAKTVKPEMTEVEKYQALELLKSDRLIEKILEDFDACGVVGEQTNKLFGYIAATSRKLDKPLAVMVQSSSAAGKSSLMDAVLGLMPAEEQIIYSAMTGQSLFYMGSTDLKHKILAISEEEGIRQAAYALKILQSEGELNIASTGKDPGTGRMETQDYHVEGPVMIFLTTTSIDVDIELTNRCTVLAVNEEREQTDAIHKQQRRDETWEGLQANCRRANIRKLHHNAQRLIRPLDVVNPYAESLRFMDSQTRFRRDHKKYLTLIRSIALLHQYQREVFVREIDGERREVIEVTAADIVLANRLADCVLGKSVDDLPSQSRRLLRQLFDMVRQESIDKQILPEEVRFTRRQVRERLGWSATPLAIHVERLREMEYLIAHGGGRGKTIQYELFYDGRGREGQPTLCGLIDPSTIQIKKAPTITNLTGRKPDLTGSCPDITGQEPDEVDQEKIVDGVRDCETSTYDTNLTGLDANVTGSKPSQNLDLPNVENMSSSTETQSQGENKTET